MGEDPGRNVYLPGDDCLLCSIPFFNSVTPKYVLATFSGITRCPIYGGPLPNGAFLLTQAEFIPCFWTVNTGQFRIEWLLAGNAELIAIGDPGPSPVFFAGIDGANCKDVFDNQIENCLLGADAFGGTGRVTWGPSIHPQ